MTEGMEDVGGGRWLHTGRETTEADRLLDAHIDTKSAVQYREPQSGLRLVSHAPRLSGW